MLDPTKNANDFEATLMMKSKCMEELLEDCTTGWSFKMKDDKSWTKDVEKSVLSGKSSFLSRHLFMKNLMLKFMFINCLKHFCIQQDHLRQQKHPRQQLPQTSRIRWDKVLDFFLSNDMRKIQK